MSLVRFRPRAEQLDDRLVPSGVEFRDAQVFYNGTALLAVSDTVAVYNGQSVAVDVTATQQAVALFNNAVLMDGVMYASAAPSGGGQGGGAGQGGQPGNPPAGFTQQQLVQFQQLFALRENLQAMRNGFNTEIAHIAAARDAFIRHFGGVENVRLAIAGWLEDARRLQNLEMQRQYSVELDRLNAVVTAYRSVLNTYTVQIASVNWRIASLNIKLEEVQAAIDSMIAALGNGQPIPTQPPWVFDPTRNGGPNTTPE